MYRSCSLLSEMVVYRKWWLIKSLRCSSILNDFQILGSQVQSRIFCAFSLIDCQIIWFRDAYTCTPIWLHSTYQKVNRSANVSIDIRKYFDKESLRDTLNSLYSAGVHGKVYQLLYKLNQNTRIAVQTGCSLTEMRDTGETLG